MGLDSAQETAPRYRAFVSYSHADARFVGWLHRKLEATRLPGNTRLAPIFIDRAELVAGPDLSAQVREALAGSAALVVVASPTAGTSRWVSQEIALFRELHPDRPVLAALIDGEPEQAFPAALLSHQGRAVEPLAADFRKGQDGRRLGLLKIVAGLTAQPLDQLVQRDAQGRQRRVMAITAGAVLLSLVLAAALVVAVRARTEAERQRAEAEGMVEFMLTDLRDKLKGVGRLDVMDTVNKRAMAHYADEDLSNLPAGILGRRARLLQAMAEDDIRDTGRKELAGDEAAQAWRATESLLRRAPDDPANILAHARSEYLLGYHAFMSKTGTNARDLPKATVHFREYARQTRRLVEIDPKRPEWQEELAYSEGMLCAVALEPPVDGPAAGLHCRQARQAMEQAARLRPGHLETQLALANRYGWEADALTAAGKPREALASRQRQSELTRDAERFGADNAQVLEAEMLARLGLARAHFALGDARAARLAATEALALATKLVTLDPANRDWSAWRGAIIKDIARYQ